MKRLVARATALIATPAKAETTDCLEIISIPAVITTQGIHCFKQNLTTGDIRKQSE